MDFKAFPDIKQIGKVNMQITQKIHGTNAQVFIVESGFEPHSFEVDGKFYKLFCGSRTRWITPASDNYGFATFVYARKEEFVRKLGPGQHFGEWAGPGINSGEGLKEKVFVLFDHWKFPPERSLPGGCTIVPLLYDGPMELTAIDKVMSDLKETGSKLVPGFMRPEGVVVSAMGSRYKKVFKAEETAWKDKDPNYVKKEEKEFVDCSHLLQPIRLEKLLSRDETYKLEYPKSMANIVTAYVQDLIKENQIQGTEAFMTSLRTQSFKFVKAYFDDPDAFMSQVS